MTVHTIDLHFQGIPGVIAASLIESGGELALIETGPGSCREALISGLGSLGVHPGDIRHVLVTHIHLDHSGGAGWWAQQGAQVYVHEKGAPHLVDPSRLIDSATRIYGDQMDSLWGPILPAPQGKVTVLRDCEKLRVGGIDITAWDTPGHARHHLAYVAGDVCFTGDVAGVKLQGCGYVSVAAAPPQFEPLPYQASVDRLLAARFTRLHLAHFGPVDDVEDHLRLYRERIQEVYDTVSQWKREGLAGTGLARLYTERERALSGISDADWNRYQAANGTEMCAGGIELYITKSAA